MAVAVMGIGGVVIRQVDLADQQTVNAESCEVDRILAPYHRPGARHAVLQTPTGQPVAAALLDNDTSQVIPIALPANPADRSTYVLWRIGEGAPKAISTFDVGRSNAAPRPEGSTPQAAQFTGYAVSLGRGRTAPVSPSQVVANRQVAS